MKHQYRSTVWWKRSLQRGADFLVDIYARYFIRPTGSTPPTEVRNILFVTLGHLGDALIGSYVFPLIHDRYPTAHIDVLAGEWCKPIFENNPHVRDVIYFDHCQASRSEKSLMRKIWRHIRSARNALNTIRSRAYDLSLEGRIDYPNGNLLCYRGRIKRRIGFGAGGFGSLLTDEVLFPSHPNFHLLDAVLKELQLIGVQRALESIRPYFIVSNEATQHSHPIAAYFSESFVILHIESGNLKRIVSKEFWLEIVRNILHTTDYKIIICGTSEISAGLFDFLSINLSAARERIVETVGKLSLDELFLLIQHAKAVFTVDSFAAHFSAINSRTISFFKDGSGALYFPLSNSEATVIHNHLPSRDAKIHLNVKNHYVKEIESKETHALVDDLIKSLMVRGKALTTAQEPPLQEKPRK